MSFFIFGKNLDNIENTLYRIAENQSDLNNLNINKADYKIIEEDKINFDNVKYNYKSVLKYNDNNIVYVDNTTVFEKKEDLYIYIKNFKNQIKIFLDNNSNHPLYNVWNNYYNQLNLLDLNGITYPLNKSLEQYFNDLGQSSLNPLQLP